MNQELLDRFRSNSETLLQILDERIVRDNVAAIPALLLKQNSLLSRIEDRLGDIIDLLRE